MTACCAARALTHQSRAAPTSDLSQFGCNSSLLFNKQFVSDVLNAGSNLIVCEMRVEVAACSAFFSLHLAVCRSNSEVIFYPFSPSPPPPSGVCVCWCARRVSTRAGMEDGGAILKGLQLHLNGIIGHDGLLLPFHSV